MVGDRVIFLGVSEVAGSRLPRLAPVVAQPHDDQHDDGDRVQEKQQRFQDTELLGWSGGPAWRGSAPREDIAAPF